MANTIEEKLVESSRKLTDIIVSEIGSNQVLFDEIIELMYRDKSPVSMRAAWVAYLVTQKNQHLAKKHYPKLIEILPNVKVDGVKRSALKMLADGVDDLNEDEFGALADIAFTFAGDPAQAIAVKAFSIDILILVSKKYPDILPEIEAILESILPEASRGLKNKCYKLLKKLKKTGRLA